MRGSGSRDFFPILNARIGNIVVRGCMTSVVSMDQLRFLIEELS